MMINPMSPERAAILAVLRQAGKPLRPSEIAVATGMKLKAVCQRLLCMKSDGQVEHVTYGQWQALRGREPVPDHRQQTTTDDFYIEGW